jgi:hypothetical protein
MKIMIGTMKQARNFLILIFLIQMSLASGQDTRRLLQVTEKGKGHINSMVDNIGYWSKMVRLGYVLPDSAKPVPPPRFLGSFLNMSGIPPQNSPDIPVTGEQETTQTENSVFIDPGDEFVVLNSNNSSSWINGYAATPYGADALYSLNQGQQWQGSVNGVNGSNSGDPATAIGLNCWWYVGRITGNSGQAVSYSKDQGKTWTRVIVGQGPTSGIGLLDKNHLWIDNAVTSNYKGSLYAGWTNFISGNAAENQVQIVRSSDQGITWSAPVTVSLGVAAQKLNHGVNIHTGPDGEVYAAWSIYDTWPSDETAIGFARSTDGGATWQPSVRILNNIKGLRSSLTSKNMRVHAFPSMAVDISAGPHSGTIYLVFPNIGYPGINTGSEIDIYLIKSTDQGLTWSAPVRVNQDPAGLGKQHFFPWITCDPVTGGLCVIYYDDRNLAVSDVATYISWSYDGGLTWSDLQVSDHSFTPAPVAGLAFSYFGDYIGIQSRNMKVYPVWTDNHEGDRAMTYTSPFDLGPGPDQPWVTYYSDSLSQVNGVGNASMNFGDSLHLSLGLKNIGDMPGNLLTATISTPSPWVTITDSVESYGNIGPQNVKTIANGFTFQVSDTIPDNLVVRFDVMVTSPESTNYTWNSHFGIESHAPDLQILSLTIIDTIAGNGNGRLEPGETAQAVVRISNTGDFPTGWTTMKFASGSPYLDISPDSLNWLTLLPGEQTDAVFLLHADPFTPIGTGTDILCNVLSGKYYRSKNFRLIIGMVLEDWETNTFTKFPWQSGGAKPWQLSTESPWEGTYCLKSGPVNDYQNSQFFINYTSATDDSISFYVRTSSEADYDYIMFTIDAVYQGQWSGDTPWTRVSFPVAAGSHIYKWIYLKDLSFAGGFDCAWVDFIALPPPVLPVVEPGEDDTICAGTDALLYATASGYDSLKWTSGGDGMFGSDTIPATWYQPGPDDISSGLVNLILTGYSTYGHAAAGKSLKINQKPAIGIISVPSDTVCSRNSITLYPGNMNAAGYQWTPGNLLTPTATYDTALLGGDGSHLIHLLVTGSDGCTSGDTVLIHFKNCIGVEDQSEGGFRVIPNPGTGLFYIHLPEDVHGDVSFTVSDPAGVTVVEKSTIQKPGEKVLKIDLQSLPDGLYLLTIFYNKGISVQKLIIRK